MAENVVIVRFDEASKSYQALSVLKDCDAEGRIELESAAVVERLQDGELKIQDSADNVGLENTAGGSLIGMLVGVLGGPVGVLVGWGAGAIMGGAFDLGRMETSDEALTVLGKAIPPETTAVIASVDEPVVEVIDAEMYKLGGEVTRRSVSDVLAEFGRNCSIGIVTRACTRAGTSSRSCRRSTSRPVGAHHGRPRCSSQSHYGRRRASSPPAVVRRG